MGQVRLISAIDIDTAGLALEDEQRIFYAFRDIHVLDGSLIEERIGLQSTDQFRKSMCALADLLEKRFHFGFVGNRSDEVLGHAFSVIEKIADSEPCSNESRGELPRIFDACRVHGCLEFVLGVCGLKA